MAFTYEEPMWQWDGDVTPDPAVAKSGASGAEVPLSLRYTKLDLAPIRDVITQGSAEAAINGMVTLYNSSTPTATYVVSADERRRTWHVMPEKVKNKAGDLNGAVRLLDVRIYVRREERSPLETLKEIGRALTEATGIRIIATTGLLGIGAFDYYFSGVPPRSRLSSNAAHPTHMSWGADNVIAREALDDYLGRSKTSFPWRLLCQPARKASDSFCVLGLNPIIVEHIDPSGQTLREPIAFDRGRSLDSPTLPPPPKSPAKQ